MRQRKDEPTAISKSKVTGLDNVSEELNAIGETFGAELFRIREYGFISGTFASSTGVAMSERYKR